MHLRHFILPIVLLVVVISVAFADTVFNYVKVVPQGNTLVVTWRTTSEPSIYSFEVERKSDEVTEFRRVGRLDAKGGGSIYTFVDDGAFFRSQVGKRFTYRLKAIGSNGEYYSNTLTITHEVSSVRRSWGMIKELFR